jgi:SAM-dependent methyltransferase
LISGAGFEYADVAARDKLQRRAVSKGIDPNRIPEIDWVVEPNRLSMIPGHFDSVLSSHAIEHQPDLVAHLNEVADLLVDGGRYFILIPDHRYCFDHYLAPSTIAEVLQAREERRSSHILRSLIEHRVLTTHNKPVLHWAGEHGSRPTGADLATALGLVINEWRDRRRVQMKLDDMRLAA